MNAEEVPAFVDTNVLVYALAGDDPRRAPVARELIQRLMRSGAFSTSTQVLQELYVVLTRKIRKPLSPDHALRYLDQIAAWPVAVASYEAVRSAATFSAGQRISFWDALVLVVASGSGAKRLYTEDMQHGRVLLGVEIMNPFESLRK